MGRRHIGVELFQSTRPVRGGTGISRITRSASVFQSTRPVRGGTRRVIKRSRRCIISIHPPRAGRDLHRVPTTASFLYFNPPAPCGAGPSGSLAPFLPQRISIHPPRAGRDISSAVPCHATQGRFQSTRPVRGGTFVEQYPQASISISIHPPRAGRDEITVPLAPITKKFQSTRPVRGGTRKSSSLVPHRTFQSTRPVRGGTLWKVTVNEFGWNFNPPAPCGAGQHGFDYLRDAKQFQSTRPVRGGTPVRDRQNAVCKISIHPPRAGRDMFIL